MTDVYVDLRLINTHLERPNHVHFHKQCWLLASILQSKLARTALIFLSKLYAHSRSRAYEADALARNAHADPDTPCAIFEESVRLLRAVRYSQ